MPRSAFVSVCVLTKVADALVDDAFADGPAACLGHLGPQLLLGGELVTVAHDE